MRRCSGFVGSGHKQRVTRCLSACHVLVAHSAQNWDSQLVDVATTRDVYSGDAGLESQWGHRFILMDFYVGSYSFQELIIYTNL